MLGGMPISSTRHSPTYSAFSGKKKASLGKPNVRVTSAFTIASGLLLDMPMADVESQFAAFMDKPYNNPIFNNASKIKGARATRLLTNGKSYGVGKYVSSISSLIRLARAIAADTFRRAQFYSFRNMGIIGFYVYRGSSYPCSLCDSMVGYHDFVYADLPPYHNNCVCYVVPVFANSLE